MMTGRCLCGDVRWEADGPVRWACFCHCESCRRQCAAPVTAFFGIADGHWRWSGREPALYASSEDVERAFCARCGTPMAYAAKRFAGETHFYFASLDASVDFAPEFHVHTCEDVPWLKITDKLPRYPGSADEGERKT